MLRSAILILVLTWATAVLGAEEATRQIVPSEQPVLWMAQAYAGMQRDDGIDEQEAQVLADHYFAAFISGCGSVMQATQKGDEYHCTTVVGRGATPGPVIVVHAASGAIRSATYPSVEYTKGESLRIIRPQ